ncbi:MAG: hypothetical protein IJP70_07725 [Bacteroidales bacterium]|nr:hypothetical protein [Bacteroidales bacterium]
MEQTEYLQQYEKQLHENLVQLLREKDLIPKTGPLPETPDITERWDGMMGSYTADAMKEIAQYPLVSLGWAMYLGLAMAKYWDDGWEVYSKHPNLYEHLRDVRGFDYLDEVVRFDLYHWDCEEPVRNCAQMALDQIRHEQIEPSSPLAYYVYIVSVKTLYLLGAAVGLKKLGYSMQKA